MTSLSGSMQAIFLAGALAAGAASSAVAADMPLPLPPPPVVEAPVPVQFGGWYLRGDVGAGIAQMSNLRNTFTTPGFVVTGDQFNAGSLGDSAFIDLGVGYQFNNWFHADVTGEYRTGARYHAIESYTSFCGSLSGNCYDDYNGNVNSAVFLANGYFDIGTWYGVTPFVGAGIGLAYNTVNGLTDVGMSPNQGFGYASSNSTTNFAWAAMAGLSYAVTPNLKLELGYRYLDLGNVTTGVISCTNTAAGGCAGEVQKFHLASQDIRLGMRWMFADIPQPAPQLPLISKY
ncbi:MAG: outer membrane protein [Methylovirgula sp.]